MTDDYLTIMREHRNCVEYHMELTLKLWALAEEAYREKNPKIWSLMAEISEANKKLVKSEGVITEMLSNIQ